MAVEYRPTLSCQRCGQFGAYVFDGVEICADCYESNGSCCPEFGACGAGSDLDASLSVQADSTPPPPHRGIG